MLSSSCGPTTYAGGAAAGAACKPLSDKSATSVGMRSMSDSVVQGSEHPAAGVLPHIYRRRTHGVVVIEEQPRGRGEAITHAPAHERHPIGLVANCGRRVETCLVGNP